MRPGGSNSFISVSYWSIAPRTLEMAHICASSEDHCAQEVRSLSHPCLAEVLLVSNTNVEMNSNTDIEIAKI